MRNLRTIGWSLFGGLGVAGALTWGFSVRGENERLAPLVPEPAPIAVPLKAVPADNAPIGQAKPTLPIGKVVLFNSGVAYFQREGTIENDALVDLSFPATEINDLMKSLTVRDSEGGRIQPLRYDSQEPIEQTLRSFGINLAENPSYGEILNQARGERVEVTLQAAAGLPGTLTGTIIGMETQTRPAGSGPAVEIEQLNLDCAEGLRGIPLNQVQRVRFLNPVLERDLRRALEVVARGHDSQRKTVRLGFSGKTRREVKVGYVIENPIWKMTYRLNLEEKQPKLEGWAAIENVSDEDWSNVKMTLVSARPISFRMDLYPPLYVPRPLVEPEQFAMLRPPMYNGPLSIAQVVPQQPPPMGQMGQMGQFGNLGGNLGFQGGFQGGFGGGIGGGGIQGQVGSGGFANNEIAGNFMQGNRYKRMAGMPSPTQNRLSYEELNERRNDAKPNAPSKEEKQQAQQLGRQLADLDANLVEDLKGDGLPGASRHEIDGAVSLARKQSALLPMPDVPVNIKHVSIYDASVMPQHPLRGLRVKNQSNQALMQGPIAVFDEGHFAGEARIADLQPNEERLISYAVDLGTEIQSKQTEEPGPRILARIEGDVLALGYQARKVTTYTIRNRNTQPRSLVIEHPISEGWALADDSKPTETTRNRHRFVVEVKPDESVTFKVAEVQARTEQASIVKQPTQSLFRSNLGLNLWLEVVPVVEEGVTLQLRSATQLEVRSKQRQELTYHVQSLSDEPRTVILEHAIPDGAKLVKATDVPTKQQGKFIRYELGVAAKGKTTHQVVQERIDPAAEVVELSTSPDAATLPKDVPAQRWVTKQGFEVWTKRETSPPTLIRGSIRNGAFTATRRTEQTTMVSVRNLTPVARTFQVEMPIADEWRMTGVEPGIKLARQALKVPAMQIAPQTWVQQREDSESVSLTKISDPLRQEIESSKTLPQPLLQAIARAVKLAAQLRETESQLSDQQQEAKAMIEEQARIRQNMEKLPQDTPLYKKYLSKLESVETTLEAQQQRIRTTQDALKKFTQEQSQFLRETAIESPAS
ncbi:hypothetical protein [Tuwongella immobilis]|uniref:DUF4139 domain-containing protein n=1 Tax=Tuwongella immobilis TaxID=692036 RepID=A0A6C2YUB1_9BACT|nr:hypothetical protein [Tuwongella immobilis]VIP04452.1 Uncharacterized protein OS=Pirellula staleyi (strain ATCC 27377 / DSM 6068 / ICPB 4128) GN=Psta_3290 PE=4 SV=1 [Tuwongella immobilis]VTS06266.1 Uncharacterized protein OS=Pirellula staleyi (strain ATCC 27377 / DSM 6068 / ICPB 4128) GN=Psta_3290 PE=4 SV=1 [Tuwongella immobilis]